MKVLGISGSLRRDSWNTKLLRAAAELLPPGAELVIWQGLREVPAYDEDEDGDDRPAAVVDLWRAIEEADAVLIATPEYNHSLPGALKNALDWMSRPLADSPLRGKPALVIGASTGMFGAVWAQAEGRKVLAAIGARVVDAELPVTLCHDRFEADGRLADEDLRAQLAEMVGAMRKHPRAVAA
ncbi:MAG: NADPH-dependent FMN reductase [Thermoleophilaceae bacterium]